MNMIVQIKGLEVATGTRHHGRDSKRERQ